MNKDYWLDTATEKIRFGPDRAAVRRELAQHLEDLTGKYAAEGLSPEEAEAAALAEMGSARDIAPELGCIHTPWWGWYWQITRLLLFFALFSAVLYILYPVTRQEIFRHYHPPEPVSTTVEGPWGHQTDVLEEYCVSGSTKQGIYRFSVHNAWLERYRPYDQNGMDTGQDIYRLVLDLRATTWRFWAPCTTSPDLFHYSRSAADSSGRTYLCSYTEGALGHLFSESYRGLPGETWIRVYLQVDAPTVPNWVEIPLGPDDSRITVSLEKGVVS